VHWIVHHVRLHALGHRTHQKITVDIATASRENHNNHHFAAFYQADKIKQSAHRQQKQFCYSFMPVRILVYTDSPSTISETLHAFHIHVLALQTYIAMAKSVFWLLPLRLSVDTSAAGSYLYIWSASSLLLCKFFQSFQCRNLLTSPHNIPAFTYHIYSGFLSPEKPFPSKSQVFFRVKYSRYGT